MSTTVIQMTALIACGAIWRIIQPRDLPAQQVRLVLTTVVFYLLLPALVLLVLWRAEIGLQSLRFTVLGMSSVIIGVVLMWLCARAFGLGRPQTGAMMLAAGFANVTNLGLPVLEQTFGLWARSVAIQMDLFATAPLLYTLGIMIARCHGEAEQGREKTGLAMLNSPPFWAAALAVALNLGQVEMPEAIAGILQRLSDGLVPLMLFSMGLALSWRSLYWRNLPIITPVIVIKMLLLPLYALWLTGVLAFDQLYRAPAIMEMAMPSMVMGIVFCDRYRLDSSLYAMAVTLTTLLSLVTLPFWYRLVS